MAYVCYSNQKGTFLLDRALQCGYIRIRVCEIMNKLCGEKPDHREHFSLDRGILSLV
jgi:hypothetical protein